MTQILTISDSLKQILADLGSMVIPGTNTPVFNYIAIWNNHIKKSLSGENYSFLFPAIFVEVKDTNSEVWLNGVSIQDLEIIFHICHQELDAEDGTLDQNFDVFNFRTYIRQYFTNYSKAPVLNTFMFKKEEEDFNHNQIYHWKETFKTRYIDQTGNPFYNGTYKVLGPGAWTINISREIQNPNSIGYCKIGTWWIS